MATRILPEGIDANFSQQDNSHLCPRFLQCNLALSYLYGRMYSLKFLYFFTPLICYCGDEARKTFNLNDRYCEWVSRGASFSPRAPTARTKARPSTFGEDLEAVFSAAFSRGLIRFNP